MHYHDFVPDALSEGAGSHEDFLKDLLKQMEDHRDYMIREIRSWLTSEQHSIESILLRLQWSQEKPVGYETWNSSGEFQSNHLTRADIEIVRLQLLEKTIRHIRNFLYPEEEARIRTEYLARRQERKQAKIPPGHENTDTRPRKRAKPARTKKESK